MRTEVFARTAAGTFYFALRLLVSWPLSLAATIALARLLQPADLGMYGAGLFVVNLVGAFSDAGLMATLVQRRQEPTGAEMRTAFTIQAAAALVLFFAIAGAAGLLSELFRLEAGTGRWLFPLIALPLMFSPISSVSVGLLNRRLEYRSLAVLEVGTAVAYQVLAVGLAWVGLGVWSLGVAYVLSRAWFTANAFRRRPWPLGVEVDLSFAREALRFGGTLQASGMTALLRDNIVAILVTPAFGPAAAGYLRWAQGTAELLTQRITRVVVQVAFPSFARLQGDTGGLSRLLAKIVRYTGVISVGSLAVLGALMPEIVAVVFGDKWRPGIGAFYCFAVRMIAGNFTTSLDNALKAVGRADTSLRIMTFWTVAEWGLSLALIPMLGFMGVAVGYALGGWVAVVALLGAIRRVGVEVDLSYVLLRPLLAGALTVGAVLVAKQGVVPSPLGLCALAILGLVAYGAIMLALEGGRFVGEVRSDARFFLKAVTSGPQSA
jgi:O-antigen/teichoic acid export membrane protein